MINARLAVRPVVFSVLLCLFAAVPGTFAQTPGFTLTPSAFTPAAGVTPGGSATATIAVTGTVSSVTLTCIVTSSQVASDLLPTCEISPDSVTPSANPSITLRTIGSTPASQYTVTVTGTSGTETETATLYLQVVDVPQDYTLTISRTLSPTTVTAGNAAQATIIVTPIAGYTGTVWLACLSVSPAVTAAPICSFNPAMVTVTNGAAPPSVLTISTYGNLTNGTASLSPKRILYALCLFLPGLVFMGATAKGHGKRKVIGVLFLLLVAASLVMLPACNSTTTTTTTTNNGLITPKNTYTFTLTGVDQSGVAPGNTLTNTTAGAVSVSLTVN